MKPLRSAPLTPGLILLFTAFLLVQTDGKAWAMDDAACMECHSDPDLTTEKAGKTLSLFVQHDLFTGTAHAENGCISCHTEADVEEGDDHPFPMAPVDCGSCHDDIFAMYENSMHGKAFLVNGDNLAPKCHSCHTKHAILPPSDKRSSTYPLNIPITCGKCHQEGSKVSKEHEFGQHNIVKNYTMSIHGKGLYKDGLVVTAVCSSCHTPHNVLKASNPRSSVHPNNINETCNQCHVGISQAFNKSVHSPLVTKTDKKLPACTDCHSSHKIALVTDKAFRQVIASQCSNCHAKESDTYLETFHGRAGLLRGGEKSAFCSDCHGAHDILHSSQPASRMHKDNIVATCAQCHPKATPNFTEYLTHANHHDKDKYPYLFYSFWAMTSLLIGTFSFFGLHTLLAIPRSFAERFAHRRRKKEQAKKNEEQA